MLHTLHFMFNTILQIHFMFNKRDYVIQIPTS